MSKKLISVCVPVYNENDNVQNAYERITAVMRGLPDYAYEIVFFDDGSSDGSDALIAALCEADEHVKAVIYARNFGYAKTVFYCMQQAKGDAAVIVHCDLQNPPEEIPKLIEKWEQGADIVLGIKNKSLENKLVYFLRTVLYHIINLLFGVGMVPHSTEFELLDKSFISVLRQIRTQNPYLRGLITEYGKNIARVYYTQDRRRAGKSHFSIAKYYDFVMGAIVSRSRCLPRRFISVSFAAIVLWCLEFFIRFLPQMRLLEADLLWNSLFIRGIFLLLSVLMLFVSFMFEYIVTISKNTEQKPMIVEKERINY